MYFSSAKAYIMQFSSAKIRRIPHACKFLSLFSCARASDTLKMTFLLVGMKKNVVLCNNLGLLRVIYNINLSRIAAASNDSRSNS
jgi:hypothetical protein